MGADAVASLQQCWEEADIERLWTDETRQLLGMPAED